MSNDFGFFAVESPARLIYRRKYSAKIFEDFLLERSPSGDFLKFKSLGWLAKSELTHMELLEILGEDSGESYACPNCTMSSKCSGSHLIKACRGAPACSPQLERYIDSLGLNASDDENRSFESG